MSLAVAFLTLGALFLVGLAADEIGRRTAVPRVTSLILMGAAAGPFGLDLLPAAAIEAFEFLSAAALSCVAFILGGEVGAKGMRRRGAAVAIVSIALVVVTCAVVALGLLALGAPPAVALLLAAISAGTDPAAVVDVVKRGGRKRREFAGLLLGVVALDDAWGLIVFSFALAGASLLTGGDGAAVEIVAGGVYEIGGAVLLGAATGAPAAALTGRLRPGEPTMAEALGVVFATAGAAMAFEVSFLLAVMTAGAVVAAFARHHTRPFHAIERVEWPFLLLFFIVAGAQFDITALLGVGTAGAAYMVLRTIGRFAGGWAAGALAGIGRAERRWLGLALTPQAGVAIGMALVAGDRFPSLADTLLTVAVASTVAFELIGPVFVALALRRADAGAPAAAKPPAASGPEPRA